MPRCAFAHVPLQQNQRRPLSLSCVASPNWLASTLSKTFSPGRWYFDLLTYVYSCHPVLAETPAPCSTVASGRAREQAERRKVLILEFQVIWELPHRANGLKEKSLVAEKRPWGYKGLLSL